MTSFKKAHGISIDDAFKQFNHDNPEVYKLFEKQVLRAITDRGKTKLSAKSILGWIRWEVFLQTKDDLFETKGQKSFKINDAYTSRYARLFIEKHPQHKDVFETRNLRS